ncbi:MAG: hypothetical protein AAGF30_00320 [Pseudomonadota bacterium]
MSDLRIVYRSTDGTIGVLAPASTSRTMEEIAARDVPTGLPWKTVRIRPDVALPEDVDRWRVDDGFWTSQVGIVDLHTVLTLAPPPTTEEWRLTAEVPVEDFALNAFEVLGQVDPALLSEEECEDYATLRILPALVRGYVDTLPEGVRLATRIEMRQRATIRRVAPPGEDIDWIDGLQGYLASLGHILSEEQVDLLFQPRPTPEQGSGT